MLLYRQVRFGVTTTRALAEWLGFNTKNLELSMFKSDFILYRSAHDIFTGDVPDGPNKLFWVLDWKIRDWRNGELAYDLQICATSTHELEEKLWDLDKEICSRIREFFPEMATNYELKSGIADEYLNQTLSQFMALVEQLPSE